MREQATDAALAAIGKNMAVGGGSSAVVMGLTLGDMAALGGLLVAIVGLGIQWYYKRKSDRREAEYHTARLTELRDE
jgi:biopolymer transport protein ExbB/TolQ